MPMATATRERLTSSVTTLHHPLDYYFGLFLRVSRRMSLQAAICCSDHVILVKERGKMGYSAAVTKADPIARDKSKHLQVKSTMS
jgi:hypothetical protein